MNSIEVCLSPVLYPYKTTTENYITVVIDVLRATSSFCAAFDRGVNSIVPVLNLEELLDYKNIGYLTAAERDGKKVEFAHFGNSPTVFLQQSLEGCNLAYSTTNGTKAVEMAKASGNIVVAAFANLSALSAWLIQNNKNVVILCSGWKNSFSLEDTLCAGALVEALQESGVFFPSCDASVAAIDLWLTYKNDLTEMVQIGNHFQRLFALGFHDDLKHCFELDTSLSIPVWDSTAFRNVKS